MTKKDGQTGVLLGLLSSGAMLLSYILFSDHFGRRHAAALEESETKVRRLKASANAKASQVQYEFAKTADVAALLARSVAAAKQQSGKRLPLGNILMKQHRLIGPNELAEALARQQEANMKLGEILIEMGLITEEQLTYALTEQIHPKDPWDDAQG
jgi:hypothetical protein